MQLKHGRSPQPEVFPAWILMSSTSVVPDATSTSSEFRNQTGVPDVFIKLLVAALRT